MTPTPPAAPTPIVRPPAWSYWPAAVVLFVCVLLTIIVWVGKSAPDVTSLQARADAAVAAKDLDTAVLTYQHLLALEPGVPKHAVDFARALDSLGKRNEAMNILRTAAPEAGGGDPAAHLLMGHWLIEARVLGGQQDAAVLHRAVRHLDAAMNSQSLYRDAADQKRLAEEMLAPAATPSH